MPSSQIRVMLVEDHAVVRDTLKEFIGQLPQVRGCQATSSGEAALKLLRDDGLPDLLVIDLSLPGMSGIDLIRHLRTLHPALRCLILSGHNSRTYVRQALAAGANGYVLKGDPLEIERGIHAMVQGENYISRGLDCEEFIH